MAPLSAKLRKVVIATRRGRLAPIWAAAYRAVVWAAARWLARGLPVGVYLRGGLARGEVEYGVSDVDLSVIAPDRLTAEAVRGRVASMRALLEPLGRPVECHHVETVEAVRLASTAPVFTHGLNGHGGGADSIRLQERPVRAGPLSNWRHVAGTDLRPPAPAAWPEPDRPMVAWLDLQYWWRHAFELAAGPPREWFAHSCVKLLAEPARTLVWLDDGTEFATRLEALAAAGERLPAQREALGHALAVHRGDAAPDLALALETLAAVSAVIADRISLRAAAAGSVPVALEGDLAGRPLVDWRARTFEPSPDAVLAPMDGSAADPVRLAEATARASRRVYPVLDVAPGVWALPTVDGAAGRLRGVECPVTDPVSFAVLAGRDEARFAELPGWSVADCAARAVRAHARRLDGEPAPGFWDLPGEGAARLFASARAALFAESVRDGRPALALTADAVADALEDGSGLAEEALAFYRAGRLRGLATPRGVLTALRERVTELPAYARAAEPVAS